MKTIRTLMWLGFGCVALSCSQSTSPNTAPSSPAKGQVVAVVNGNPIMVADLEAEITRRTRGRSLSSMSSKEREAVLQELIKQESVFAQARSEGFDQSPQIARQIHELIVSRYLEAHLGKLSVPTAASEDEIQQYYDQHSGNFATSLQVRFAVIKLGCSPKATKAKRAEAFVRAQEILRQAQAAASASGNKSFEGLARQFSDDQATRYQGGDAGWISRTQPDRWDAAVIDAAFAMVQPGDVAPVVVAPDAFYLIKLLDRKEASRRPLAEVSKMIAYQIELAKHHESEAEFFEHVRSGQQIKINRTVLDSLPVPLQQTEAKPPSPPAG